MPKQKKPRYLLETSVLRKLIWGTELEKKEINSRLIDGKRFTSEYCLKEFYIGVINTLIEFYFLFQNDYLKSSHDVISSFSQNFGARTPKLMMVFIPTLEKNFTNEKIEDSITVKTVIFELLQKVNFQLIEEVLSNKHNCAISKLKINEFTDEKLREFYRKIKKLYTNEPKHICKIKEFIGDKKEEIELMHTASRIEVREMSQKASQNLRSCKECSKIGDLIISMENTDLTLITEDRTQERICLALKRPVIRFENKSSKIMQASAKSI